MKKINLCEYIANNNFYQVPEELVKDINGGCTRITVGRCLNDGTYFIASVVGMCSSYSSTCKKSAKSSAKNSTMKKGQYYNWPMGTITG